jgi:hypothetical protein
MPSQKRTIDEPAIREFLTGIKRGSKLYYRADPVTGRPIAFHARSELMKLAKVCEATGSRLLKEGAEAGLIQTGFVTDEIPIRLHRDDIKVKADKVHEKVKCPKIRTPPTVSPKDDSDDNEEEDEEDAPKESGTHCRKSPLGLSDVPKDQLDRYELVRTGSGFWGWYDREQQREVILSRNRDEVLEEIYALRRQGSNPSLCYPGRFNS